MNNSLIWTSLTYRKRSGCKVIMRFRNLYVLCVWMSDWQRNIIYQWSKHTHDSKNNNWCGQILDKWHCNLWIHEFHAQGRKQPWLFCYEREQIVDHVSKELSASFELQMQVNNVMNGKNITTLMACMFITLWATPSPLTSIYADPTLKSRI